jgi:hypothetical protein
MSDAYNNNKPKKQPNYKDNPGFGTGMGAITGYNSETGSVAPPVQQYGGGGK